MIHDLRLACQTNDLFGSVLKAVESVQWEAALRNLYEGVSHGLDSFYPLGPYHLLSRFLVRTPESDNHWDFHVQIPERQDDTFSDHVASGQPTEDVNEDSLNAWVGRDNAERGLDSL